MNELKQLVKAIIYRLQRVFGHTNYQRFVIVARSRTGSNLLLTYLNSHPNVYAEGEIFRHLNGRHYRSIMGRIFGSQPRWIKATGFKLFYYHPIDDDSKAIWDDLDGVKVIHLRRRNVLRSLVSKAVAHKTEQWAQTGEAAPKDKAVELETDYLEYEFGRTREWEQMAAEKLANNPTLNIYYEDMVLNSEAILSDVFEFIGVRQYRASTQMRKQNPEPLAALIRNYDDLREYFSGSRWEAYFDETAGE